MQQLQEQAAVTPCAAPPRSLEKSITDFSHSRQMLTHLARVAHLFRISLHLYLLNKTGPLWGPVLFNGAA